MSRSSKARFAAAVAGVLAFFAGAASLLRRRRFRRGGPMDIKEISRRLNIGLATTKSHVHNLLAKLELERRGQVARWSREHAEVLRDQS